MSLWWTYIRQIRDSAKRWVNTWKLIPSEQNKHLLSSWGLPPLVPLSLRGPLSRNNYPQVLLAASNRAMAIDALIIWFLPHCLLRDALIQPLSRENCKNALSSSLLVCSVPLSVFTSGKLEQLDAPIFSRITYGSIGRETFCPESALFSKHVKNFSLAWQLS